MNWPICFANRMAHRDMIRFGKSSDALLQHKQAFFEENESLRTEGLRAADIYTAQPRRSACKCCTAAIGPVAFTKQGIEYHICENCGHLNGSYEDTDAFCAALYTEDNGRRYARNYKTSDRQAYLRRVEDIYLPKAEFLRDGLVAHGVDPTDLRFADFGAGSGYFVAAMRRLEWQKAIGFEVSKEQVELADEMIEKDAVRQCDLSEIVSIAGEIECDVISMVGVLEHLQQPREVLAAIKQNRSIRYIYLSVPLFSPCVFLELIFPRVFQRQLTAGHTHLFTDSSLDWVCREFELTRIAEWWFGTDMVDLMRSVSVELALESNADTMSIRWLELFGPVVDELQIALDRHKLSSEVHMLLEFST
jgi:SAM-dependent methyltransferase